ncbi:hypothetical protein WOLCODRAFT_98016 [Wolfiporia cocos MD-104 SS10]|uniref:Uncharacterized protein n=1 Tax=Wolfiporia cocos (strain MD-104) TaxID=742152 RepID=A0A2H3JQA9_WOLCO|nr:hypothetical protein WOLCODRAFT_98016 [Wolfiporia cocos MD-104 SS10]
MDATTVTTITSSTTVLTSIATAPPIESLPATSPPIVHILRILTSATSALFSLLTRIIANTAHLAVATPISTIVTALYTPVAYLLAPLTLFLSVLFDVCVRTPNALVAAILDGIYPLYAFVGASCICAGCVGLAARLSVKAIRAVLLPGKEAPGPAPVATRPRTRASVKEEEKTGI